MLNNKNTKLRGKFKTECPQSYTKRPQSNGKSLLFNGRFEIKKKKKTGDVLTVLFFVFIMHYVTKMRRLLKKKLWRILTIESVVTFIAVFLFQTKNLFGYICGFVDVSLTSMYTRNVGNAKNHIKLILETT